MNDFPIWVQLLPKVTFLYFLQQKNKKNIFFFKLNFLKLIMILSDPVQSHHWQQSEQEGRRAVVNTL